MRPKTRYARGDGGAVAYQVTGKGPDLIYIPNWLTNIEVMWDEPSYARFLERLASFSRLICFDKRGSGISDTVPHVALPTLDAWMDDVRVVMEAVGSERAALLGWDAGGLLGMLFAASFPERTSHLVLLDAYAWLKREEDYPIGIPMPVLDTFVALVGDLKEGTRRGATSLSPLPMPTRSLGPGVVRTVPALRSRIGEFRGREVKTTGDGVLATFDGPARAIRCAAAIARDVRSLGIEIKAGLHTGEVEVRGEDIGGIAVHTAARVMAAAGPGEVLLSRTVKDLVAGSGTDLENRGEHELKGVPGEWRLYAVKG